MDDRIPRAIALAAEAHGEQRYGTRPYLAHLLAVVENLHRFGVADDDLVCAAWLHDVVEDTEVARGEVEDRFGPRVAALVHAVTTEDGRDRKERSERTYPKISGTPGAVRLKLADRIANVESCWADRSRKLFMYEREYATFREHLRDESDQVTAPMWEHLDKLLGWRG
jgi:(p)ppGpp synthase/HD superfamily hydrolase